MPFPRLVLLAGLALLALPQTAFAHFPWLTVDDDGKAAFFFGEGLGDRTYHLPESIAKAKVHQLLADQPARPLELASVDKDDFVGLVSNEKVGSQALLASHVTYGVYHGSRLDYYTLYQGGALPTRREAYATQKTGLELNAQIVDTDAGVDVFILWQHKPLADVDVRAFDVEGTEVARGTTDAKGRVSFSDAQLGKGQRGLLVGHTIKNQTGEVGGEAYASASHYLTVTFTNGTASAAPAADAGARLAPLPYAITSFGAARIGDAIYVYGGHTGEAHSYSTEEQTDQVLRLDLNDPAATWTEVAKGDRLQGVALIAHDTRVIAVGGFSALNAEGEDHDLRSLASVRALDTNGLKWSDLPSLPEGRSSHDAALLGDTIYVVGGWTMDGEKETQWLDTAWALDLSAASPEWKALPHPTFHRRALSVVAHEGKIYCIGGMAREGGPSRDVDVYDPETKSWSDGPSIAGEQAMAGFGASGWSLGGELIITTYAGDIQRLSDDGSRWETVGKTQDARFFHRLIPLDSDSLVSIGGANMGIGKFLEPEIVHLP